MRAWTVDGKYLGTLCRDVTRGRNPKWDLPFNVEDMRAREDQAAVDMLLTLRSMDKTFTPLHNPDDLDSAPEAELDKEAAAETTAGLCL